MTAKPKNSFVYTRFLKYMLVIVFLTITISPLFAQGNLLIYPKRVVFEGRQKMEKLVLSNIGKDTAVYNISFLEYKMNVNGALKIISEPLSGQRFASSNVRFFPRRVTLAPNESQTVKVQLRNAQNLTEGEYRSHLYFRAGENNTAFGKADKTKDSTMTVELKPIFGLSIACIIRKGTDNTSVFISDLEFNQSQDKFHTLQFNLNRKGNMSIYGDFTIHYIATDGTKYEVSKTKGIGLYTPGNLRHMNIKLNKPKNINFEEGHFKVVFTQNESKKVLTEAELKL